MIQCYAEGNKYVLKPHVISETGLYLPELGVLIAEAVERL